MQNASSCIYFLATQGSLQIWQDSRTEPKEKGVRSDVEPSLADVHGVVLQCLL